jgi:hypothetical protein
MCIFGRPKAPTPPPPLPPAPPPPAPPKAPAPIPEPEPATTEVNPKVRRAKERKTRNQYAKGSSQLRIPRTKGLNNPTGGPAGGLNT